ncbi:glucoamylase family protein [Alistipes sp.]|uniref:glucoamylase family protein n=1 Tax=Alistipes sp. TaxID=1872444 RepID=UPI003A8A937C
MKTIKRFAAAVAALALAGVVAGCGQRPAATLSDEALMDTVERRTFDYFWSGAEPNSGLARERIHMDGLYPENDETVVTTGGSGFGILALIAGIERGYITREQGVERFERIVSFLERADRFHGAWPHWIEGTTGRVKPFGRKDNGGDLVETAFLVQGLLAAHQYFAPGNERERRLAERIDTLWRGVEWSWYRNGQNVLYWHWSPEYGWEMDFAVHGFNECLVMYLLAAASPTYPVDREVYTEGWAENGAIVDPHEVEGYPLHLRYQGVEAGPLFWAHYSFLGLDPRGLRDAYCDDYRDEMRNYSLINRAYCIRNPKHYKGYGRDCWGLTASYSTAGYAAHAPVEREDRGVIAPTAALSSIVYTPEASMEVMRHLYGPLRDKVWGLYGFYDAFSQTDDWYPQRYLAIDQGPIAVMIENHRSELLWRLFMSHPDVQRGLRKLGFGSPALQ